jgi:hypothetical protein
MAKDCQRCGGLGSVCTSRVCSHPPDEDCPCDCECIQECPDCKGSGEAVHG